MKIIFQDPFSSLNPRMTVEQTIMEPLTISGRYSKKERQEEAERLMTMVGIDQRLGCPTRTNWTAAEGRGSALDVPWH